MDIMILLFALAGFLAIIGLVALFWAIRNNQFEDPEGDAARILFDDEKTK